MTLFRKGNIFHSVTDQKPQPYWKFNDKFPQYIQVQRTLATISGTSVKFNVNSFDPNAFMRSKAYIKLSVNIQKRENEVDAKDALVEDVASNYDASDRIYRKPGLVLQNACTYCNLRLNSHSMIYKDLRYIRNKLDMSFAGRKINNTYFTTSGSLFEDLNGVYNEFGCIYNITENSTDDIAIPFGPFGFDIVTPNQIEFIQNTNELIFTANGGGAIDLLTTQLFTQGDGIILVSGEAFKIIGTLIDNTLLATRLVGVGDIAAQNIVAGDLVIRNNTCAFNGDDGREHAYDDAFKDITVGATDSIFNYIEPLSFGPWNHLSDFNANEIYCEAWNNDQTALVPYVRELELSMNFLNIAANSLVYTYGRQQTEPADPANTRLCRLQDVTITAAELVLFWVKPRDNLLLSMPQTVKIQSWMYQHNQFDLGVVNNNATVSTVQNNIYTDQQPTYILYYASVDKDSESYSCTAINNDFTGIGGDSSAISVDVNSVETCMHPNVINETTSSVVIRSNTLGGDDLFDGRYSVEELYRITLKNSISDFPYNYSKFRGLTAAQTLQATYPSRYYFLFGESELNSFFIRKGQLQTANVMNFTSDLVASDGYSISKNIEAGAFNGGNKQYALHIFYVYDRFYIQLSADGTTDSKFDSVFF